jgi:hypothetical protein
LLGSKMSRWSEVLTRLFTHVVLLPSPRFNERASRLLEKRAEHHVSREASASNNTHVVQSWIAKGANVDVLQCRRPTMSTSYTNQHSVMTLLTGFLQEQTSMLPNCCGTNSSQSPLTSILPIENTTDAAAEIVYRMNSDLNVYLSRAGSRTWI